MDTKTRSDEPFSRRIISSFIRVDRLHRQAVETAINGKINIHRSQHHFLMYLSHHGNLASQKELADHFNISPACVAVTLKKLEGDGYITRNATCDDSRRNEIGITDSGRKIVLRSEELFDEIDNAALEGIPDVELEAMKVTLDKIFDNLVRMQTQKNKV